MKKSLIGAFALLFGALAVFAGCGKPTEPKDPKPGPGDDPPAEEWTVPENSWSYSDRIFYVRDLGFATGPNAHVNTSQWNMTATDLGFAFYDEELGRLYAAFGDTNNNATPDGGREWNTNVILYTDDLDFTKGVNWQGALPGQNGSTRTVTPLPQNVVDSNRKYWGDGAHAGDVTAGATTCIPTGGLVLGGTYYLWYMEVGAFDATGEWDVYRSCVVKSSDKGQTWTRVEGLEWVSKDAGQTAGIAPNFGQIYPLDGGDGYVYIYGIPGGRSGGVKLGRVAYGDIEDFESYEYYKSKDASGTVTWRKGSNGLKSIKTDNNSYIVAPSCGEISVHYNAYLQRYVMSYMQNNSKIVIRRSATPWGDWSASDIIMDQSNLQGLYGGFSHAAMSDHDGKRIYLFVSEWYPTYNVHLIEVVFA